MEKAKYIGKYRDEKGRTVLEYMYRGYTYEVTDYGIWMNQPLSKQHREEQAVIDMIADGKTSRTDNAENVWDTLDAFWEELQ